MFGYYGRMIIVLHLHFLVEFQMTAPMTLFIALEDDFLRCFFARLSQIFKTYIEIELQLGNINRCRTLYEKYLEWSPANCYAWSKYAELERSLGETERGRSIFEIAIAQPLLDMPELLWKVGGVSYVLFVLLARASIPYF